MIDPKLNTLPVTAEGDFEDRKLTPEQSAARAQRGRSGLSINDTIAATATLSVGARGADTSGVEAGTGAGGGTTYLGPGTTTSGSPAPTIVPGARGSGSTIRGEQAYEQEAVRNVPTTEEISTLAYDYWMERGCPHGSHDEDWQRAEEELYRRTATGRAAGA